MYNWCETYFYDFVLYIYLYTLTTSRIKTILIQIGCTIHFILDPPVNIERWKEVHTYQQKLTFIIFFSNHHLSYRPPPLLDKGLSSARPKMLERHFYSRVAPPAPCTRTFSTCICYTPLVNLFHFKKFMGTNQIFAKCMLERHSKKPQSPPCHRPLLFLAQDRANTRQ